MITHFSEKLTLKSLAAEFNMNPNYCCSLFTKYLGQTFSAYLTELRITEAQNLLHNSDYSLEEIACMVGFKDYFYFSKVFKNTAIILQRNIAIFHTKIICLRGLMSL
mgnify:CR=1 FL=1